MMFIEEEMYVPPTHLFLTVGPVTNKKDIQQQRNKKVIWLSWFP